MLLPSSRLCTDIFVFMCVECYCFHLTFVCACVISLIYLRIPEQHRGNVILGLIFATALGLVPGCHYAGSSYLLGAFLTGLMYCQLDDVHHIWVGQVKRMMQWMLRIFFSATIGFAIPIGSFTTWPVWRDGMKYSPINFINP